jgi:hypothetical protein
MRNRNLDEIFALIELNYANGVNPTEMAIGVYPVEITFMFFR